MGHSVLFPIGNCPTTLTSLVTAQSGQTIIIKSILLTNVSIETIGIVEIFAVKNDNGNLGIPNINNRLFIPYIKPLDTIIIEPGYVITILNFNDSLVVKALDNNINIQIVGLD